MVQIIWRPSAKAFLQNVNQYLNVDENKNILDELEELEDIRLYDESKNDNEPAIAASEALQVIEAERKKLGL
jgi:hypothetical protein